MISCVKVCRLQPQPHQAYSRATVGPPSNGVSRRASSGPQGWGGGGGGTLIFPHM